MKKKIKHRIYIIKQMKQREKKIYNQRVLMKKAKMPGKIDYTFPNGSLFKTV